MLHHSTMENRVQVAILLYDGVSALTAVGPSEIFQSVPGLEVCFVGRERGEKRTDFKRLGLIADYALDEILQPDILVVPGTPFRKSMPDDPGVLEWIRSVHQTTTWTASVCTGALALGAAGLLQGRRATTHWLAHDTLPQFGAIPVAERVVRDGKIWTSAGISAGIDMALTLVGEQFGDDTAHAIQLIIEYDPQPPYDVGSPDKATTATVTAMRAIFSKLT